MSEGFQETCSVALRDMGYGLVDTNELDDLYGHPQPYDSMSVFSKETEDKDKIIKQ